MCLKRKTRTLKQNASSTLIGTPKENNPTKPVSSWSWKPVSATSSPEMMQKIKHVWRKV
jgi:hypothetical protein